MCFLVRVFEVTFNVYTIVKTRDNNRYVLTIKNLLCILGHDIFMLFDTRT